MSQAGTNLTSSPKAAPYNVGDMDQKGPVVVATRDPVGSDRRYALGTLWVNKASDNSWQLTSVVGSTASWVQLGIQAGTNVTIAGDFTSTGGNFIADVGDFTATLGAVSAGTTVSAGTSISATTALSAGTTVTAGTGITATTGNIVATAGDITASAGDIAATLGSVAAGTTVTGGTGVVATTGDVAATAGNLVAGVGIEINEAGAGDDTSGLATLVLGTQTVATTAVTANSRIQLTAQALGTVAAPMPLAVTARNAGVDFTITSSDATDTSTVAWLIINPV